jgi:imidazolonepropionase-like amidohydrolase
MKIMNVSDELMEFGSRLLKNKLVQFILKRILRKNAINALNAGITTLRTMGDPEYLDVKLRKEIREGKLIGPRLLVSGPGICTTGGHGGAMSHVADSVPEIRKAVRKNLRNEVDLIKILSTGGVMDARNIGEAGRPQMTVEEIETACFEAHRANLLVATHCESTKGIKEALKGGVDTIEHGAEIPDELVPLFKNNPNSLRGYTALISTLSAGMGLATLDTETTKITDIKFKNAKLIEEGMIKGFQKAYKQGIKLGCGTDASVPFSTHYGFWKELKYYTLYSDMSAKEAIHLATLNNAEILGIDDITGSIEIGKSADLLVVKGNPREDITHLSHVKHVFIRGKFIKNPKIKKVKEVEKKPIQPLDI